MFSLSVQLLLVFGVEVFGFLQRHHSGLGFYLLWKKFYHLPGCSKWGLFL